MSRVDRQTGAGLTGQGQIPVPYLDGIIRIGSSAHQFGRELSIVVQGCDLAFVTLDVIHFIVVCNIPHFHGT